MQFFGGEQREAVMQGKPCLFSENRPSAGSSTIVPESSMIDNSAEHGKVGLHVFARFILDRECIGSYDLIYERFRKVEAILRP